MRTFIGDIDNGSGRKAERTSECRPSERLDSALRAGNGRVRTHAPNGAISPCDP